MRDSRYVRHRGEHWAVRGENEGGGIDLCSIFRQAPWTLAELHTILRGQGGGSGGVARVMITLALHKISTDK